MKVKYYLQVFFAAGLLKFAFTLQAQMSPLNINQGPTIDVWYGTNQEFGQIGIPQTWANILGNVSDPDGIQELYYKLNNGAKNSLNWGPDNTRLENAGDFNIELDISQLLSTNTVTIVAKDSLGDSTVQNVTVIFHAGNVWPSNYSIDWSTVSNIQDVAQIVDGKWAIVNNQVRTIEIGYDRLVAIGDTSWRNQEVLVPITTYSGFGSGGGVGVLSRWHGHEGDRQPRTTAPYGALAWFRKYDYEIIDSYFIPLVDQSGLKLAQNTPTYFRFRTEWIHPDSTRYSFRVWEVGDPEPSSWLLIRTMKNADPITASGEGLPKGSVLLVAHRVDAGFGNVTITKLPDDQPLPVVLARFTTRSTPKGVIIEWETTSEINNLGFHLYRSEDGENYRPITTEMIKGAGNSNVTKIYSFLDELVVNGQTYFYQLESIDYNGQNEFFGPIKVTYIPDVPVTDVFELHQNYPNPFNPTTSIPIFLPRSAEIELAIFNILGEKIRTLAKGSFDAGTHVFAWDGRSDRGDLVSSGIYVYELIAGNKRLQKKMVFMR